MFSKMLINLVSLNPGQSIAALIVVLVYLASKSQSQNVIAYPCADVGAISWVRDSTFCEQYYICHFGQPLTMPSCPSGQVWSNKALNCVPRNSRWDDCSDSDGTTGSVTELTLDNNLSTVDGTTGSVKELTLDNNLSTVEQNRYTIPSESSSTKGNLVISLHPLTRTPTPGEAPSELMLPQDKIKLVLKEEVVTSSNEPVETIHTNWYQTKRYNQLWDNEDDDIEPTEVSNEVQGTWTSSSPSLFPPVEQERGKVLYDEKKSFLSLNITSKRVNIDSDHPCFNQPGALLPHSKNCHWYFNCSMTSLDDSTNQTDDRVENDAEVIGDKNFILMEPYRVRQEGMFVWECRYPQLFDAISGRCREFINVDCKSKFQPVDQCEYTSRQCSGTHCVPCDRRFGRCRGKQNGVYPLHPSRWTPMFVTCYQERNIAQDECSPPTPIFSPELLDCVSLFEVPKQHGGFLPDCSTRQDGYYPDEQGRCAIFFRCALGQFRGYDECPPGSVFDPAIPACQPYSYASKPCGEGLAPLCGGKLDGFYADPYGRCTTYFQCKHGVYQQYFTCDLGIFDPLTQRCVLSAELTVRPCGLQPSPCEVLPTGVYPDQETGCQHFIECHHGNMITNGTCDKGTIFSAITGRCDLPQHSPPPCGVSSACSGRPDGRYPALSRGCSFFYECYHGEFISLRRCTEADGGIFFNMETGSCDYPQNICPPCGYRWWGCPRTYETQAKIERN